MNAILLTQNLIPIFAASGDSIYAWSLTRGLIQRGYSVHLVAYNVDFPRWQSLLQCETPDALVLKLANAGIQAHLSPAQPVTFPPGFRHGYLGRAIWPRPEYFYAGFHYAEWVMQTLQTIQPEVILAYMVDAVSALQIQPRSTTVRRVAFVTDLDALVRQYRRAYSPQGGLMRILRQWRNRVAERSFSRLSVDLLKTCDRVCCSAHHHAHWLRQQGLPQTQYFPVPVPDQAGADWQANKQAGLRASPLPRVLMLGSANGIATLAGLHYLRDELLPALDELAAASPFELRLVGGGTLDSSTATKFHRRPWIQNVGYVDDVASEFFSSTIFLSPTPIPLGFRTRIAEAFSYGACVIAHASNAAGMPELLNEQNILLPSTPAAFHQAIQRCLSDPVLRETLGGNARKTYEEKYQGERVVEKMLEFSLSEEF